MILYKNKRTYIPLALTLALSPLIAACGSTPTASTSASTTSTKPIKFAGGTVTPLKTPVTVTVADDKDPAGAGIMLANALGYFKQLGINIKLQTYSSGADAFNSLAANQLDVGRGLISSSTFNSYRQGLPVYLVADGGHNLPGRPYAALMLRQGLKGKVTHYSQLKGLNIGMVSVGNINQLLLDRALAKGGLTNKDVHITVVDSFPDLITAMGNKAIDGAEEVEPDIYKAVQQHIGFVFKDPAKYAPNEETSTLMFSSHFIKNTAVAKRFMLAYLEGVRYFNTHFVYSKHRSPKVMQILHKYTGDPISLLSHINPAGLSGSGLFSVPQVQQDENWYHQYGTVSKEVPASKVVNLSFAKWADKILGPYHHP